MDACMHGWGWRDGGWVDGGMVGGLVGLMTGPILGFGPLWWVLLLVSQVSVWVNKVLN